MIFSEKSVLGRKKSEPLRRGDLEIFFETPLKILRALWPQVLAFFAKVGECEWVRVWLCECRFCCKRNQKHKSFVIVSFLCNRSFGDKIIVNYYCDREYFFSSFVTWIFPTFKCQWWWSEWRKEGILQERSWSNNQASEKQRRRRNALELEYSFTTNGLTKHIVHLLFIQYRHRSVQFSCCNCKTARKPTWCIPSPSSSASEKSVAAYQLWRRRRRNRRKVYRLLSTVIHRNNFLTCD